MERKVDHILPDLSFAYRPRRGTTMAILKLKQLLQRRGAIVFFLDASDAFGCIIWGKLFTELENQDFDINLIAAISRLYRMSSGRVIWRGTVSTTFVLQSGVRQGGSISGHLFNIYFACLDRISKYAVVIFYADDLVIIVFHPWAAVCVLAELTALSKNLNINWNPAKCKVMQMPSSVTHNFSFYGGILENVSRYVYLGWTIVRKLRNCGDEQAAKQASRLYAAANETSEAYSFVKELDWEERATFVKTFSGIYDPECYTSLSEASRCTSLRVPSIHRLAGNRVVRR